MIRTVLLFCVGFVKGLTIIFLLTHKVVCGCFRETGTERKSKHVSKQKHILKYTLDSWAPKLFYKKGDNNSKATPRHS